MSEKKSKPENDANNIKIHALFAISSLLLLVTTGWMIVDDHYRQWKVYQRKFNAVEQKATEEELQQVRTARNTEINELEKRKDDALQALNEKQKTVDELKKAILGQEGEIEIAEFSMEQLKAEYDMFKYASELAHHEQRQAEAKRMDRKLAVLEPSLRKAQERVKVMESKSANNLKMLRELDGDLLKIEKKLQGATREIARLESRITKLKGGTVETLRNLPILDYADPTLKIKKVVVNDLYDDYNFVQVPKIDRCITCHLGIDKEVIDPKTKKVTGGKYDSANQPFTSHSRLDLFLSDTSPHPMGRFGCTICHEGGGNETDFSLAAHSPGDEKQAEKWTKEYGWSERHHWEHPMFPLKYTEANCGQCHESTFSLPGAEKLSLGRKLYYEFNCFNCHKTRGYESFPSYGPRLTFLADKLQRKNSGDVDRQWLYNWIKAPREFRSSTRMPHFFFQSNTQATDDNGINYVKRHEVEILSIAHYLLDHSRTNDLNDAFDFNRLKESDDVKKGKELVETIGCFGCHNIGPERPDAKPEAVFGPHLTNLGNKTIFEWLFAWLKAPEKHWPEARMPDLRLTDEEGAAISSYLISLTEKSYRPDPVPETDTGTLDKIVIEYLEATLTFAQAVKEASAMSRPDKMNYAGEKLIRRYGCYSCHSMEGIDDDLNPIGTDQSTVGSKPLSQIDFGFVIAHHEQTRHAWLDEILKDPRVFDKGRKKSPQEKLIMPMFDFSDEQREALVTFLLSLTTELVPPHRKHILDERGLELEGGRESARQKNCLGCHIIEPVSPESTATTDAEDIGPVLSIEGTRIHYEWLHKFLLEPFTLRPKAVARMPNFRMKSEDADAITRYFARVATNSDLSFAAETEIIAAKEHQLEGETLFEMSNCQSCHVVGKRKHREPTKEFYIKEQMDKIVQLTPDLEFARGRLRTDWARKLILDPQSILPEIKMPGLKLLDRDVVKIMTFIFTYPVDQIEWLKWAEEKRKEEENKSETFGDEFD